MQIKFITKDKLVALDECPDIEQISSVVMRPMWSGIQTPDGQRPKDWMEYRRYEFRGEVHEGVPVVHET